MEKHINMIMGGFATLFGLGLIVFGAMAIFAPDKIGDLAQYLSQKTGILNESEGPRGIVEFVEGQAERRLSGEEGWVEIDRDEVIRSGTQIRTLNASRAVVTFEDGSVIRLNENSLMEFISETNLILVDFSSGEIYNRVTKNQAREFVLRVEDYRVVALGTAFDVKKENEMKPQVMVVESEVEIQNNKEKVIGKIAEGKKSILDAKAIIPQSITEDDLQGEFLSWNIKNDEEFFNKQFADAEREGKDGQQEIKVEEAEPKPVAYEPQPVNKPTSTTKKAEEDNDGYATAIGLSGKDDGTKARLYWDISGGKAPEGFKVVKSKLPNPTYPEDDYLYIKDPDDRACVWKGFKKDKTYHFRICVYKKGKCATYSNDVEIDFEGD